MSVKSSKALATWSNGKVYVRGKFYLDVKDFKSPAFTGEVYLYDSWVVVVFRLVGSKTQQVAIPRKFIRSIEGGP